MIPKNLFFCFGLTSDFGGKPWSLVHYVCLRSAIERIKPSTACLYYEYTPNGPWWELTKHLIDVRQIKAPRTIFGNELIHPAHRADVFRLKTLLEQGGIYLDCDVFVHRNFDALLPNQVVLGEEGQDGSVGLCNAVLLAQAGAPFVARWYDAYKTFRSKGHDDFWNEHSVRLPMQLARQHPDELTILPQTAFFWPSWRPEDLEKIFQVSGLEPSGEVYATHLWEALSWKTYLEGLTPQAVRDTDSPFHHWARPFVDQLLPDFGRTSRTCSELRRIVQGLRTRPRSLKRAFSDARSRVVRAYYGRRVSSLVDSVPISYLRSAYRRQTFRAIYRTKAWGGDSASEFYSGVGSRGEVASRYVQGLAPCILEDLNTLQLPATLVDLGCGDFNVSGALLKCLPPLTYIGCDIVPDVIKHHSMRHTRPGVTFLELDIVRQALPPGDICIIRQVLQHLSNNDIAQIAAKLGNYRYVYITEAEPLVKEGPPNPDKPVGSDLRFDWRTGRGRGVEVSEAPWHLQVSEVFSVLEPTIGKELITTYKLITSEGNHGSPGALP